MRPILHFTPEHNWMNDPNGLIYFEGNYHIFYQHFPYDSRWGTMHWGHAISKDLVHFEYQPIALYPSKTFDRNGCFSGSALAYQDKLYLYYTSIKYAKENPEYIHIQYSDDDLIASQALVISDDGITFDNEKEKYLVVDVIKDEKLGDVRHTRDPKVWLGVNGNIYMIIGSKFKDETGDFVGEVLFYESKDGKKFEYKNRYYNKAIGDMWECPDLFKIDDKYFLIFSPENINQAPDPVSNAVVIPCEFDEASCTLSFIGDYHYLDYGLDFYAPQTFVDEAGRRVMLGWMRMLQPIAPENWVGIYTFPRVLTTKDDWLYQDVHPNIKKQFREQTDKIDVSKPFNLQVTLTPESKINIGGFRLYLENDQLFCNREQVALPGKTGINNTPKLDGIYELSIYYDHHIFEIYINGGKYVLSQLVSELNEDVILEAVDYYKVFI